MEKVVIYGAGQLGELVAEILSEHEDIVLIGFVDDDQSCAKREYQGLKVLGDGSGLSQLREQGVTAAIAAIGKNRMRAHIAARLTRVGFALINAIHPTAYISKTARLGKGLIVNAGAIIETGVVIGDNVYIGASTVIGHHSSIGSNALVSGGSALAARVDVEIGAFIGLGARLAPPHLERGSRLRIGENAVVGTGAVVIRDVPDNAVVVGVPAKIVHYREPEVD